MYSHYAFRLLAAQLAQAGFSVLRFDWSGTGDSAGNTEDARLSDWRKDLQAAEQELLDLSRATRLSLVAFRLGTSVAASTELRNTPANLLLWEPVVSGRDYLAELRAIERYKLASDVSPPSWWNSGNEHELLGHAISQAQRNEIEAFNLLDATPKAKRVHIITGAPGDAHAALASHLQNLGIPVFVDSVDSPDLRSTGVMLPGSVISHIAGVLKAES